VRTARLPSVTAKRRKLAARRAGSGRARKGPRPGLGEDARDPQIAAPPFHVARGPEVARGQRQREHAVELRVDEGTGGGAPIIAATCGAISSIGTASRRSYTPDTRASVRSARVR
jgi:hypothetical protein